MSNLRGDERARYVQQMFSRIAGRYDLMNRIMTAGQDLRWRKEVIRLAELPRQGRLLDLGAGTGDLSREAAQQRSSLHVVAADFTLDMMRIGMSRLQSATHAKAQIEWCGADANRLPFPDSVFDAVVSAFLLRNLGDLPRSLAEQYRVLKPGGRIVALDTTPPPQNLLRPAIEFHLYTVIPALGSLIAGQAEAYRYLPDSTVGFLEPERLAVRLMEAGFQQVGFRRMMLGAVAIYWGLKPFTVTG